MQSDHATSRPQEMVHLFRLLRWLIGGDQHRALARQAPAHIQVELKADQPAQQRARQARVPMCSAFIEERQHAQPR